MLSGEHEKWLEDRGLSVEVAVMLGVHSRGPKICFPYTKGGQPLYVKARDPNDKAGTRCLPAGVEQTALWLEDTLDEADPQTTDMLIITEGEPDAIAFRQAGFGFVVSVPSGAAATPGGALSKAEKCLTVVDGEGRPVLKAAIAKFKRVLVAADCDHDGLMLREAIVKIVGAEYCWLPQYPAGTKDANDVLLRAGGTEAVRALADAAQPVKSDGFIDFIEAERQSGQTRVYSTGIAFLEPHIKLVRPEFIVVGGQAGHGKSSITQALLFSILATNHDFRASIFHGEGEKAIPVQRAKKFWRGRHWTNTPSITEQMQRDRDAWIKDKLAYISPPQDELPTFEWLMWAMEQQALYRRRNVFVVDPWNEIIHERTKGVSTTDYVGDCIIRMKRLADRLGLILIVSHHVTKPKDGDRPPSRYDLADSAHWANKADHVILAWKPREGANQTRVEIAKSKDYATMGVPGTVWVTLPTGKDAPFHLMRCEPP